MNNYTIQTHNGTEVPASIYQAQIFDKIINGSGNMVINAAAGSAKTTTIVNALRFIPEDKTALFIAFNNEIVATIKDEVDRKNTKISTFHSLGLSILKENKIIPEGSDPFEFKYINYIKNNISNITSFKETRSLGANAPTYINNIKMLVEYCRYYLAFTTKQIERVADLYDIVPIRDEFIVCRDVLLWGKNNLDTIDYTDMVWLPNVLNLSTKRYLYDWIFVDEAQDTSIMEQNLCEKCFKRNTRFVAVGDKSQQINTWCGATQEAIDNFEHKPNTEVLRLPISYRCPKAVVEYASKYGYIEAADGAEEGAVNFDVSVNEAQEGDMILCRTTAPLVDEYLHLLKCNKKVYLKGMDGIRSNYLSLIRSTKSEKIDVNCITVNGMFPMLYKHLFEEIEKTKKHFNIDDDDAMGYPTIYQLYDNIEGIKAIAQGLVDVNELIDKINMIFSGSEKGGIILSTVHKAKGLEANNVFILYPSLMPFGLAHKPWELEAEKNLQYVAYTRAKKTLNFITEPKNAWRAKYASSVNLKSILNDIKTKINYNSSLNIKEGNIEMHIGQPKVLGENAPMVTTPKQNKVKGGLKFRNLM